MKSFLKMAWLMRTRKRRNAGSPGSDTNESTASLQFILISTRAESMARRFVWSSMTARDLFLRAENFLEATGEASIDLVRMTLEDYGEIRRIREVITDHGTQFFANKMDKNGDSESAFDAFLAKNEIKHILARVKHPQTDGKIEIWYHTYEKSRKLFDDFDKFLNWYNSTRYHESLDEKHYLQTRKMLFGQECLMNAS